MNNLIQTGSLQERHDKLAKELTSRGYKHSSPMDANDIPSLGTVDPVHSLMELSKRCKECSLRIEHLYK